MRSFRAGDDAEAIDTEATEISQENKKLLEKQSIIGIGLNVLLFRRFQSSPACLWWQQLHFFQEILYTVDYSYYDIFSIGNSLHVDLLSLTRKIADSPSNELRFQQRLKI